MTKTTFVNVIAENAGVTQKEAAKVVNAVFEAIAEVLIANDKIQLPGFGTFETRARKARQGRNPHTGEPIDIPACTAPVFKASKTLRDRVSK